MHRPRIPNHQAPVPPTPGTNLHLLARSRLKPRNFLLAKTAPVIGHFSSLRLLVGTVGREEFVVEMELGEHEAAVSEAVVREVYLVMMPWVQWKPRIWED